MIGLYLGWWLSQPEEAQVSTLRKHLKLFLLTEPRAIERIGALLPSPDARLAWNVLTREIRAWPGDC